MNSRRNFIKYGALGIIGSSFFPLESISKERFIKLTPYQYDFSNYSKISFKDTKNLYQHDFWATSYKELVKKITLSQEEYAEKYGKNK